MTKSQRRKALKKAGLTSLGLADELGVHNTSVSRVVNGDASSLRISEHIAKRCGIPLEKMFPRYATLQEVA